MVKGREGERVWWISVFNVMNEASDTVAITILIKINDQNLGH